MEGVTELMEHRLYIITRQEGRLSLLGRRSEVADIVDHRLGAEERALLDEVRHPSSSSLRGASEEVCIEECHRATICIEDLPNLYSIGIDGQVCAGLEGQAIELIRCEEDPVFEDAVEDEVGLKVCFIQVKLDLLEALSIVVPVPSLELEVRAFTLPCELFQLVGFLGGLLEVSRSKLRD